MKPINTIFAACLISAVFPQWVIILAAGLLVWWWTGGKAIELYSINGSTLDNADKSLFLLVGPLALVIGLAHSYEEERKEVFGDKFSRFAIRSPFYFKDSLDSE